ncbi:hypothetical protein Pan258_10970 [Symmachiella dynata]|uniref:hypothetical protein n=1 Tax=Symmachiella dynata TaxID=2527995 RepID=UPI00118B0B03|nr:hypothetical protein [Symmachiella dynata]QDT47070.1 hypothetical protein Pan258_10970 [Symmachiella dynata]
MTTETATNLPVRVVERIGDWRAAEVVIDLETGIVRNVALAGPDSKNGYRYTDESLRRATVLYADKPVFLDHGRDLSKPQERSTRDLAGQIVNPRFVDGRIRGDIQTLGTEAGRTFLALADSGSGSVGMSHVVLVTQNRERTLVEEIHEVVSVDAVMFPATTSSLSEQTNELPGAAPLFGSLESVLRQLDGQLPGHARDWSGDADVVCERVALFPRSVVVRLGAADDCEQYRIGWRVRDGRVWLSGEWEPVGDLDLSAESWQDLSRAQDTSEADDADSLATYAERLRVLEAEKQLLLVEVSDLTAERDMAQRVEAVGRLLAKSELPEEAITETFREQLLDASDDEQRGVLLDDRVELFERLRSCRPTSCLRADDDSCAGTDEVLVRLLACRR